MAGLPRYPAALFFRLKLDLLQAQNRSTWWFTLHSMGCRMNQRFTRVATECHVGHHDYDLPALQKHIVDRFIHGKPHLVLDIPQVIYRRDVYTATSFANIRKKVSRQVGSCVCRCVTVCLFWVLVTDQIESERAAGYRGRPAIGTEDTRLSWCGGDCNGVSCIRWTEGWHSFRPLPDDSIKDERSILQ